jgi:nucleoside-diphosphate-sugar epimerase
VRVLVTGGFGNIGRSAVAALREDGHRVRVLSPRKRRHERLARRLGIEPFWGDARRSDDVAAALVDQDAVVHLAAILPPDSDEQPELARSVNVDGTRTLLEAAAAVRQSPRLLFASTFDVFGHTTHLPPPRRLSDPVAATDAYTAHKIECEAMVAASGLEHVIFRFSDVPKIALRPAHPIMFEIPLDTRIETLHTRDAGVAVSRALASTEVWGRTFLVGGGARCQVYFRDYLAKLLTAMGVGPLPEEAFGRRPYPTDWIDTEESERLLRYQRHSFDDIVAEIAGLLGWRRPFVPLLRPLVRRHMLGLSPYWAAHQRRS